MTVDVLVWALLGVVAAGLLVYLVVSLISSDKSSDKGQ
ncbi:potassium-transporting ATPase subunit F [Arthrobacter woluwensis]|nr:potassium-transporting ATPase subunit F [Arthrobacter woluwensis]QTF72455.1 potassium-transporting ATPase subunit F [Arthrobacter woluwensis]